LHFLGRREPLAQTHQAAALLRQDFVQFLDDRQRLRQRRDDADAAVRRLLTDRLIVGAEDQQGLRRRCADHLDAVDQLIVDDDVEPEAVGDVAA